MALLLAILIAGSNQAARGAADSFVNFETPPVHPIALSPDGGQLAVCNLADGRLELFDVSSGTAVSVGSVPVGLDRFTTRRSADPSRLTYPLVGETKTMSCGLVPFPTENWRTVA